MTALIRILRQIVGNHHVMTGNSTQLFVKGYRFGGGPVAAVVRPASLKEQWFVFRACIAADHIVIVQAANTGLTGGSTPHGAYDRPVVIINTMRIGGVLPILGGRQVICLAGATLHGLTRTLDRLGREPHSVIGSSCIGASVIGGICNNSGGALVARGPAYTEYALYAAVDAAGGVVLKNHLGIHPGRDAEEVIDLLDRGRLDDDDVLVDGRVASCAADYAQSVRDVDAGTPARFNADPSRLYEASGSAGRVMVLAARLDTFPKPVRSAVFYIGTNSSRDLTQLRREILSGAPELPVSGEYIHRDAFDIAATYGKDTVLTIERLGTDRLPALMRARTRFDRVAQKVPLVGSHASDRLLQGLSRIFPPHLPRRMLEFRDRFEHHLIIKAADGALDFLRDLLARRYPNPEGGAFECSEREGAKAMLHRFAVAGAAVRYRAVHRAEVAGIVALDVALRRNDDDWFETLPPKLDEQIVAKLYYGHFFCHVFHQDYLVRAGCDPVALEHAMLERLDRRGAEYPAEHNVGHCYAAKPALVQHYRALDPGNRLNPGIGGTSRVRNWS